MAKWWEKEPVRFECQKDCFKCCLKPGVIYFSNEDIRNVSQFLKVSPAKLKAEYLVNDDGEWMIDVEQDRVCPFLGEKGCLIHEAKPRQCRAYPFWRENLETKKHWRLTGGFCPGIDIGPMIPAADIKKDLKEFPH
ncbi:MAG: YkgJ family cysteine cluster protein [Nitrospinales bacterium]